MITCLMEIDGQIVQVTKSVREWSIVPGCSCFNTIVSRERRNVQLESEGRELLTERQKVGLDKMPHDRGVGGKKREKIGERACNEKSPKYQREVKRFSEFNRKFYNGIFHGKLV